jgi:alkylation response protein AidB-like acyl-CoA dehydrogenase
MKSFSDPGAAVFRQEVRAWLREAIPPEWRDLGQSRRTADEEVAIKRRWDTILADGGYSCLTWPIEFGGRGLGPVEEFIFYEEAAAAHAPEGLELIGKYLAGPAIIEHGSIDQQNRYLPAIVQGTEVWCEGFSEPNAGSDLASLTTAAERHGGIFRINGHKIWTSIAHVADLCFLLARTSQSAPKHHNLSVLIVNMHQPGIRVRPIRQITGAYEFNEVFFDNAVAAAQDILGEENGGWQMATITGLKSTRGTVDISRRYVYLKSTLDQLDLCCQETSKRVPELEWIRTRLQLLRWHIMRTSELRAGESDWMPAMSILKVFWSELWQEMTSVGVTLGCRRHEPYWELRYLDSRAATIYSGTSEIQRNVIAKQILHLPQPERSR